MSFSFAGRADSRESGAGSGAFAVCTVFVSLDDYGFFCSKIDILDTCFYCEGYIALIYLFFLFGYLKDGWVIADVFVGFVNFLEFFL